MTSPAMQERREVVKAARRDAELAQRFHDRQWHKRHRVRPKPLSLEGPTNAEHIALYQLEKARSKERRTPIVADELERVRAAIANLEENSPFQKAREKGRKAAGAASKARGIANRPRRTDWSQTQYRCGHPRTPENTYFRSPRVKGGKPGTECKTCAAARDKKRNVGNRADALTAGMPTAYGA
jgi:hypothetical protein